MLHLTSTEIRIVNNWAENGLSSPFPQEAALIKRLKNSYVNYSMAFTPKELEVILLWAEKETRSRRGTARYLLDIESELIGKIEKFLSTRNLSLKD
jgi:hypothetical protein